MSLSLCCHLHMEMQSASFVPCMTCLQIVWSCVCRQQHMQVYSFLNSSWTPEVDLAVLLFREAKSVP